MKTFFSALFRWLDRLRRIFINALFVLLLLIVVVAFIAGRPGVPDGAALVVNPKGSIVEELSLPASEALPLQIGLASSRQTRLHDLLRSIEFAAADDRIGLMILRLDEMDRTSLAKLQEIRRAIHAFRAAGKSVIAVGPNYSQSQYYLAAAADHVFLDPMGVVALHGFSIYRNYIKEALARLHVNVQLFRAGEYKAAAEPLVRNDMSEADRIANRALLEAMWTTFKNDVAGMRGIRAERLQQVLDEPSTYLSEHRGSLAELAQAEGLVDELAGDGEIQAYIAAALDADEDYPTINFRDYLSASNDKNTATHNNGIGIIIASGMILDGNQPSGVIGSKTMSNMLEKARKDEQIKAVVLRIDSPGGSAPASEAIRDSILRLKRAGKPVIVSMSGMAASGGYWIAAPADEIWASETTVTGSIGAFAVLADVRRGLEKLGLHSDGLGTTSIAQGIRTDRELPPELARVMQLSIQHVYGRFLHVVADGRQLPEARIASMAEGRAWSGLDAKRLGLVDRLGGFNDAVAAAAKRAGLGKAYEKVWIRPPRTLRDMFLARLFGNADTMLATLGHRVGQGLFDLVGISFSEPWMKNMEQWSRLIGLSAGQPGIVSLCLLQVE